MNRKYSPWNPFFIALVYLLTAIAIATLLAYPIYLLLDLNIKFPRLINRLTLGILIIGIYPVSKKIGLSAKEMGFAPRFPTLAVQFCKGFVLGTVILGIVVYVLIMLDVRTILQSEIDRPDRLVRNLVGATATGFIVSILEETLFRGLLFGACLKYGNIRSAFLITAFFYAGLHFIGGRGEIPTEELHWTTGFQLVPDALLQIFNLINIDSFLALFSVSLFLSAVLIETPRGIGYCIGLHAAWVFVLKLTKRYTEVVPDNSWKFLVGSYDGVIGYLVCTWLLLLTIFYGLRIRKNFKRTEPVAKV